MKKGTTTITAKEIKQIMKDKNLSYEDIASKMEVSWATVSRWARDIKPMSKSESYYFQYLFLK
jgi:DNA-binding transcriptional regulator YiaG